MAPTPNENKENKWVPKLRFKKCEKSSNNSKELELHFIQTDSLTVRNAEIKKELRYCLAPYEEVLVQGLSHIFFFFF